MRPLSFTRNLGGFEKAYGAIRAGFVPGVTVKQFQERCGLGPNVSHLVTEFLLGAYVQDRDHTPLQAHGWASSGATSGRSDVTLPA
jgi:hypothetical protein